MGEQLKDGLGQAWTLVASFVPKLIGFLIILLIGWLIAKGVAKALTFVLGKLGFSKLIEKTGLTGMLQRSDIDATAIIAKLVYYFILLLALQLAFGMFGPSNPISQFLNRIIGFLPRIVVALVLVIVAAAIAKVLRDLIVGALGNRQSGRLLGTIGYWLVMALGIIAALNQVQIATTVTLPVLITVLATVGGVVVVGFGGGLIRPAQQRWDGWLAGMQQQFGKDGGAGTQASTTSTAGDAPTPPGGFQKPQ